MDTVKLLELATPYLEKNDFGVEHTKRVFATAKQNFPVKKECEELALTSIILHDIGGSTVKEQYEKGPQIAKELLKKLGCPDGFIKQVCEIISTHHEHPENPSEPFRILYDSDKIVMFTREEYAFYNARKDFDWNKIIALIYSRQGKQLAEHMLAQRRKDQKLLHDKVLRRKRTFFKQIQQHGDNFSYIIADEDTKEAAVVDSSFNAEEIINLLSVEKLDLKYVINTHGHSDHTAGNTELTSIFPAKIVAHKLSRVNFDVAVEDGDLLTVGRIQIKVIHTPGHTVDSICLLVDNEKLLTGDTLFVGECGRTDLAGGSSKSMYDSLFNKLMKLDDAVEVYPGHDYGVKTSSTIGEEKKFNYTLQPRSLKDFIEFMAEP